MGMDSCGMLISAVHKEKGEEKLHLLHAGRRHSRRRKALLTLLIKNSRCTAPGIFWSLSKKGGALF